MSQEVITFEKTEQQVTLQPQFGAAAGAADVAVEGEGYVEIGFTPDCCMRRRAAPLPHHTTPHAYTQALSTLFRISSLDWYPL